MLLYRKAKTLILSYKRSYLLPWNQQRENRYQSKKIFAYFDKQQQNE